MSSNHNASSATFNDPIAMLDASDVMSATQLRTSLEALHDNTAYSKARAVPATQAQQEAATDIVQPVTPGRQHFHPSAAKFWAYITMSGSVPTLAASYNVTSVTDETVGSVSVVIATDFSSVNWAGSVAIRSVTAGQCCQITTQSQGGVSGFCCTANTAVAVDPNGWSFIGFGDQ